MARKDRTEAGEPPRIVWVSGAYGYDGDLIYFRDVFAEFVRRFPGGEIPVRRDFPVERYPELPLRPLLRFIRLGRSRRRVGDVEYLGVYRIPTPGTFVRLLRERAAAHILIEFSPTSLTGFVAARLTRRRVVLLIESDPAFRGAPGSVPGRGPPGLRRARSATGRRSRVPPRRSSPRAPARATRGPG